MSSITSNPSSATSVAASRRRKAVQPAGVPANQTTVDDITPTVVQAATEPVTGNDSSAPKNTDSTTPAAEVPVTAPATKKRRAAAAKTTVVQNATDANVVPDTTAAAADETGGLPSTDGTEDQDSKKKKRSTAPDPAVLRDTLQSIIVHLEAMEVDSKKSVSGEDGKRTNLSSATVPLRGVRDTSRLLRNWSKDFAKYQKYQSTAGSKRGKNHPTSTDVDGLPRRKKAVASGFLLKSPVTLEMSTFMKSAPGVHHSRVEVTKQICACIRDRGLQRQNDRRLFDLDEELSHLLKYDTTTSNPLTYFQLQKLIQPHFLPNHPIEEAPNVVGIDLKAD